MDKSKIGFIAAAVVFVVAAGVLGFFAWKQLGKASEASAEKEASASALDRIYKKEIFPNAENVKALDSVLEEFGQGREAMTNLLAKSNVNKSAPGEISPSAFQSKLSAGIRKFHEIAPLVDGRKSVADSFAFGFDAYYGKDAMPKEEEVPLLVQQLGITALLVREIYVAQVSQLTKIERDARDAETLALLKDSGRGRKDSDPEEEEDTRVRKPKKGKKAEPERAPLFTSQKMALEFTARQNALIDLLNRLNATQKPFVVVKSVSAKKTGDDLRKPPAQEAAPAEGESRRGRAERERPARRRPGRRGQDAQPEEPAPRAAEPAAPTPPAELPPEMRVVSGPDIDPPLSVRLELEIFNFGEEIN